MNPPDTHAHGGHGHGDHGSEGDEHHEIRKVPDENDVSPEEVVILRGCMESATTDVGSIMVPLKDVKYLNATDIIDKEHRYKLYIEGYSRIPVVFNNRDIK